MADLMAEQARLRPALDRLLRLAAGWADPVMPTEAAPEAAARAGSAALEPPPAALPDGAAWCPTPPGAVPPDPASRGAGAGVDEPAAPSALALEARADAVQAPGQAPVVSRPVIGDPAQRVAIAEQRSAAPLPRFRLAPSSRRPGTQPRRGLAGAALGVTAHAAAHPDFPGAGVGAFAPPVAPAGHPAAAPAWSTAALTPSAPPSYPGVSDLRGTPGPGMAPAPAPRHAAAALSEAGVFAAALEADLEERLADILERAALDAGIDLP